MTQPVIAVQKKKTVFWELYEMHTYILLVKCRIL